MCHDPDTHWVAGQHIVTSLQFVNGSLQVGGVVYPVVAISCANCGNTHFVNAVTVGLLIHIGGGKLRAAEAQKREASDAK